MSTSKMAVSDSVSMARNMSPVSGSSHSDANLGTNSDMSTRGSVFLRGAVFNFTGGSGGNSSGSSSFSFGLIALDLSEGSGGRMRELSSGS